MTAGKSCWISFSPPYPKIPTWIRWRGPAGITGNIVPTSGYFPEEERSKQPSFFSIIRTIIKLFGSEADPHLGLYGAFGYDLAFQFEPIRLKHERPALYKEAHLFLPDELILVDHRKEMAQRRAL